MECHLDQTGFESAVCLSRVLFGITMSVRTSATLREALADRAVEIALRQLDEVAQTIPQDRIMKRIVGKFSSKRERDVEQPLAFLVLQTHKEIVELIQPVLLDPVLLESQERFVKQPEDCVAPLDIDEIELPIKEEIVDAVQHPFASRAQSSMHRQVEGDYSNASGRGISWKLCSSHHRSASKNVWWNRVHGQRGNQGGFFNLRFKSMFENESWYRALISSCLRPWRKS